MTSGRLTAARFAVVLAGRGLYHFSTQDAATELGGSLASVRAAVRRLEAKGEVAQPFRGFFVIVPPEYRRLGCLPAEQFISQLMENLGELYYVALLSAAELHGAAHQRPQGLQVMVKKERRALVCGEVRVSFAARKDLERIPVVERSTPRGLLRVASIEATAFELVGYAERCGGLDNVASVLAELGESIHPEKLVSAAVLCPIAWAQRLGYLFELVGHGTRVDGLASYVEEHARAMAPLVRTGRQVGVERVARWKLILNAKVEPEP